MMQKKYLFLIVLGIVTLVATIVSLVILLPNNDTVDNDNDDVVIVGIPVPTIALTSTQFNLQKEDGSGGSSSSNHPHNRMSVVKSSSGKLLTLVVLAKDGTSFKPVGRSYNGNDWETSAGEFAGTVVFDCRVKTNTTKIDNDGGEDDTTTDNNNSTNVVVNMTSSCLVDLPDLPSNDDGSIYQITLFDKPEYYTDRDIVARFLEQSTFGATLEEIDAFATSSTYEFAQWIYDQQTAIPIMSHRALYRRHMNAQFPVHNPTGPVTGPCQVGCRYRRAAFSVKDTDRILTVQSLVVETNNNTQTGDTSSSSSSSSSTRFKKALLIDGHLRTIVDGTAIYVAGGEFFEEVTLDDGDYVVCYVLDIYESVDVAYSMLLLNHPEYGDCVSIFFQLSADIYQSNPLVGVEGIEGLNGTSIPVPLVIDILDEDADPIDSVYTQAFTPKEQGITLLNIIEECPDMTYSNIESPTFVRWQNTLYLHDPHFVLLDNTATNSLHDGGGEIVSNLTNPYRPDFTTLCSNVARTFLNEDGCYLSNSTSACSYVSRGGEYEQSNTEPTDSLFRINHDSIRTIYNATGAGEVGTVYLYAIDNLNISLDPTVVPPCHIGSISRWVPGECTGEGPRVTLSTSQLIGEIVSWFKDENNGNEYLLDIYHPDDLDSPCTEQDMNTVGFEVIDIEDSTKCWRNVHPDHWNVYDFTEWVASHPGNSATRNPIKEFAENGNSSLVFPNWHELKRWNDYKFGFGYGTVRYGDMYSLFYLPYEHITEELASALGLTLEMPSGDSPGNSTIDSQVPTLVCGSPYEVRNDPSLGGQQERGAFDTSSTMYQTTFDEMIPQKRAIWIHTVMEDPGQLRQRAAWALSQILVISPSGITEGDFLTEAFVSYYDIFVRNAFGNYRTVLKEVSYSPQMGDMLTYIDGRSTSAVMEEEGNIEFPDENFAREGLFTLNMNGTEVRNSEGIIESVYSNDDIEEYARAWTGFVLPVRRGNIEGDYINRIDPMRVVEKWRDRSPKMGLNRKYIGDGYPLCLDLPARHFLLKGAKYRLLGGSPNPEMQIDPAAWLGDTNAVRLNLDPDGGLFSKLCSILLGSCSFQSTVVLDETIECVGVECEVDTVRVVQVNNIFYEYVRQPCVHQAFFPSGIMVARKLWAGDRRVCSDPRIENAVPACCEDNWNNYFQERYWGERTTYQRAQQRCRGSLCNFETFPSCENKGTENSQCLDDGFFWTSVPCISRVKVNDKGKVAVVHSIPSYRNDERLASVVDKTTQTFFRVDWMEGYDKFDCKAIERCEVTIDEACVCDVMIEDEIVFKGPEAPTKLEIQRLLHIGAVQPLIQAAMSGEVKVFIPENQDRFSTETVFEFVDEFGVLQRRKNIKSTVTVVGTNFKFRNPPHFMSFVEETSREAHYETDATLDQYLYHQNTPPFLALRFAQRFGVSNPSPRYVETIANAFKSGLYTYSDENGTVEFGTGTYADLSSTFAAVLLDPEARDITLDSDPTHGAFKEPIIKTIGMFRSMRLQQRSSSPWIEIYEGSIGQMAHNAPSVFSFFLPEYQPSGRIAKGSLVAPEGQVLTGPRVVDNLNAVFSLLKYGMTSCNGGFIPEGQLESFGIYDCDGLVFGRTPEDRNLGILEYQPSVGISSEALVNELATLLTAGRLSLETRKIIQEVYDSAENDSSLIKAQMMIAASPEFHVTNLVRPGRKQREETPPPPPATKSYKAVVNVLLQGGVDSFNMLAPHQCASTNIHGQTLLEQYNAERTTLAFSEEERTRVIDASGQPCEQFAVHPDLPIVEKLYNSGALAFFANIGQLDVPVTKDDYYIITQTELFSHNTMQYTAQSVDPWKTSPGTGILGRMCDSLAKNGFQAQPISIQDATVATVGVPGESKGPLVVSATGLNKFAPSPEGEAFDIKMYLPLLTNETDIHSSIFAETYMETLMSAVSTSDRLFGAFERVKLTQTYPTDESPYISQIKTLTSLILTHGDRGSDRDVFFLTMGEWDHHESLKASLSAEFLLLNEALQLFEQEMKTQGYFENVTVVVTSDFGRTLTANSGSGSDHAWGGNTFAFGGAVNGGVIHGDYPADITASGPLNLGRGRLIPTLSWESMFNPIIEWMGVVSDEDLDYCMPNRHKTGTTLFSMEDVFQSSNL